MIFTNIFGYNSFARIVEQKFAGVFEYRIYMSKQIRMLFSILIEFKFESEY